MRSSSRLAAIGIEFAGAVIGCLLLGYWLDGKLHTSPWLTLAGIFLGAFAGFWAMYRAVKMSTGDGGSSAQNEDQP